jgi:hypothetical protein
VRKREMPRRRLQAIPALIRGAGFRSAAATALLLCTALAATGCGLGPGAGLGDVQLTVTRDYGARSLLGTRDRVTESDTVMRVLDRKARISTRYGGGFVQSVEGLEGGEERGRRYDWFFYVNGVASTVGAADYPLRGGDAVWWDYRDWSATIDVPAVVGSWPQPFVGGYDGRRRPVTVDCLHGGAACGRVRSSLEQAGVSVASGSAKGAIRVLVGPWSRLRADRASAQIDEGPAASGVFAEFGRRGHRFYLWGLNEAGSRVRRFAAGAGLVAATRRYEEPPVWIVTGGTPTGVEAAAGMLDSRHLRDHYAVAVEGGEETPLPVPLDK